MIRLLCIEDQFDIQTILKLTLEASGRFQVSLSNSGADERPFRQTRSEDSNVCTVCVIETGAHGTRMHFDLSLA